MAQIWESLKVVFIPPFKDGKTNTYALLMWCIFLAAVLVFIAIRRQNATLGKLVRVLRDKKATDEDTALPLSELGKIPSAALKGNGKLLATVEKDGKTLYYLPESAEKKADALLKAGSTPFWLALLEILGLYVVLLALYYFLTWYFSVL